MSVQLNHTIVHAHDRDGTAAFYCQLLGLPDPVPFGPFLSVDLANGVTLDFAEHGGTVASQHYAFLVDEDEFDVILGRLKAQDLTYYADPGHQRAGEHNTNDGGRGLDWSDPTGHNLEILTRPYGG
ncbi:MAG: VOC family protein [Mycobacteriales bacterium]